ncbi:uncharacterized protein LOC130739643 [Lotus japonicus]|uniref:uncharacterized protein LOC130739643 n=1 Tax=Lotus japonicus TaxID=34305 RepID=UPI002585E285|nr:uncharacterized protein LOC130739643 [Lotus japonicus]
MYVTRVLSMYKSNPQALVDPPPSGPNSGYLIIMDKEYETYNWFGHKSSYIRELPFPQNKDLTINYGSDNEDSMFVPVLNQPLSSNRYYVIRRRGKEQGHASTSSKEEDMETCLCCLVPQDVKPKPLEPFNDYQQIEIIKKSDYGFEAKSVAPDGIPPGILNRKGWMLRAITPSNYRLGEALGSNDTLRSRLPDFNFPLSNDCSESVVVGKWYCPFMFVKEGMKLKAQMKMSVFYELTLEQRWEKIFSKEKSEEKENAALVDVVVQTEAAKVAGRDADWDENSSMVVFTSFDDVGVETRVGLSLEVVEGMKWEQERVGWIAGNMRQVRVERVEEFGGTNEWRKFGCYVLVESFVLKRMDTRLVLTCDYSHTNQIRCKWE